MGFFSDIGHTVGGVAKNIGNAVGGAVQSVGNFFNPLPSKSQQAANLVSAGQKAGIVTGLSQTQQQNIANKVVNTPTNQLNQQATNAINTITGKTTQPGQSNISPIPNINQLPQQNVIPNINQITSTQVPQTTQPLPTTISQTVSRPTTINQRILPDLTLNKQKTFGDVTNALSAAGNFKELLAGATTAATAITHPFQTIGAALDPNKSIADVTYKTMNQPLSQNLEDTAKAGVGYISAVLGFNALVAGLEATGTAALSGDVLSGDIVSSAAGQTLTKADIAAFESINAGEIATNTATTTAKVNLLAGLASQAKNPLFVMGALATYAYSVQYAKNPLGDAVQSLQIAMSQAQKAGDAEGYNKMKSYYDDLTNPTFLDKLEGFVPVINVLKGEAQKVKASKIAVDVQNNEFQQQQLKDNINNALELKINAGIATDSEIQQYAKDNPYSVIAALYKQHLTDQQYIQDQQTLEAIKTAGAQARADIYAQGKTSSSGGSQFEAPSSLGFGLLHTAGGYEQTKTSAPSNAPQTPNTQNKDNDLISNYLFGIPYAQLTDEQKMVVDKW